MQPDSISWQAHEYEHKEKSVDWFWALGIIALSVIVASVIKGNYVFALFILVASVTLGFFSARKPDLMDIQITEIGITIQNFLYDYKTIRGFFVEETTDGPVLHILTSRIIFPLVTLPLNDTDPHVVRDYLLEHLPEQELHESRAHKIMETLGF